MKKINVITRNADITRSSAPDKVVVVINTLFSTSAVVHALEWGAEAVHVRGCWESTNLTIAALGRDHCAHPEQNMAHRRSRFANEPVLSMDSASLSGNSLVLTCRATSEALYMAGTAAHIYVAALLNVKAMVTKLTGHEGERLELICTGPGAQGSFVDLYVAGYIVDQLMHNCPGAWGPNDSALTARSVYLQYLGQPYRCISDSPAEALLSSERLGAAAQKACEVGQYNIVPRLCNDAFINASTNPGSAAASCSAQVPDLHQRGPTPDQRLTAGLGRTWAGFS